MGGPRNYYTKQSKSEKDKYHTMSLICEILKIIQKDTWTLIFMAALFTIAKTWKQPKCPSTDEWIKKTWYNIHRSIIQ